MLQKRKITTILLCLCCLTACKTTNTPSPPTSERLSAVKETRLYDLRSETSRQNLKIGNPTFIRIFKQEGILETWIKEDSSERYALYKTFPICKFSGHLGPKLAEGDEQAPEGFYEVGADQLNPWSEYHLSFNLGFPNKYDQARMRTGSNLMVHGGCESIGCYAITDKAMEEVYLLTEAAIANGKNVPVHIFPFRMTPRNMYKNAQSQWFDEWQNLEKGYILFEQTKTPPQPLLKDYHYAFQNTPSTNILY
ncbi:MAG: 2-dehydro-3-deoxyphosphooctonate aldolase [Bdellovibrionales bacterium]